jgi:glycosyltransferase involved in cell wall biosynthesis
LRDKLVVFLGRLTHQKGPEFLLETAGKVCRVYPRVKFVVAGTGDQFAHLLETSAYRKLGSKFIFTGFLTKTKVDELLNMADVYFMPSVSEPFGLTALEAAQHHVPAVLSSQSGAAEVMKSSLQADFWDTDKYANYIHALLRYNALHHQLSESASDDLKKLTWEHAAEKIHAVYQQFLF